MSCATGQCAMKTRSLWLVFSAVGLIAYFGLSGRKPSVAASTTTVAVAEEDEVAAALKLIRARRLHCTVGPGAVAEWKSGKPVVSLAEWGKDAAMDFDSIDVKRGTARGLGAQGSSNEVVLATESGLSFIEQTGFGNLDIVTVSTHPIEDAYPMVESRHMQFPAGPLPSQYHGTCRILPSD